MKEVSFIGEKEIKERKKEIIKKNSRQNEHKQQKHSIKADFQLKKEQNIHYKNVVIDNVKLKQIFIIPFNEDIVEVVRLDPGQDCFVTNLSFRIIYIRRDNHLYKFPYQVLSESEDVVASDRSQ